MSEEKKRSILVVDDESSNIMTLSHILSPDYTVYAAKNGQSALKAAEKHLPDVILLDVIMPEMDGYAVITALKASENTKNIPVIFITGLSGDDNEEKGLSLGAADYICKPFSTAIVKIRVMNQIKALEQLRIIERLSMTDQLTDLPNRRCFETRLQTEWRRALRERTPISILVIDVDHFKIYNDTYGHQQGDVALKAVAGAIEQTLKRSGDFSARWGGEEFIALLSNTDLHGALDIAEQIRVSVETLEVPCEDRKASKLTVSIGTNTREYGGESTTDEFISRADMALYEAKKKGRNMVCRVDL
ncbi:MAG: diguanylate cyclase [Oscillospiraceae bacterium]|nr:diguanylate cyclase [Oscillospiraceae bacterium]